MLHSASKNLLRIPRVITNPPVSLKEPFCFDREDPKDYSLVGTCNSRSTLPLFEHLINLLSRYILRVDVSVGSELTRMS
jgi:hypothetical protein